ncbi:hypothetical protein AWB80_08247 [Caballeronia pedi]|uniref:DUF2934 domain-containing protein n=1 Tax=Caballeronia pedi TaxID=1777141 RepID=A0A158E6C2_9BURK|nr:DUF2934 domain-containing protein [Caballeronia pedi]SAL01966.1 hypothetical protein AWB80_08247 [Caballeronia pedi]
MNEQKGQDRIRRRAYEIWEREGSSEGRAEEFLEQAIASIGAEDAQNRDNGRAPNGDTNAAQYGAEREAAKENEHGANGKEHR